MQRSCSEWRTKALQDSQTKSICTVFLIEVHSTGSSPIRDVKTSLPSAIAGSNAPSCSSFAL